MKSFLILLFSIIATTQLHAQNIIIDSIPFRIASDSRIYVYCKVNNSDTLSFLIDTGATDMVINSERLDKVDIAFNTFIENKGTTGTNKVRQSKGNTLFMGNQKLQNLSFIELSYSMPELDGVIGLSVLKRYCIEINYDTRYIYLYDKNSYINNTSNNYSLSYKHGVPFITLEINPINQHPLKLSLEVDTGSDRILDLSEHVIRNNNLTDRLAKPFAVSTITSSDNHHLQIFNTHFESVKIGAKEFYLIPGGYASDNTAIMGILNAPDVDGMLGNCFLKRFNQTYDFKNEKLHLTPNKLLYSPFYDFLIQ